MNRLPKRRYWAYSLIVIAGLINVIANTNFNKRSNLFIGGDAQYYIQMSFHTFAHVPNPYAFRLMSPLIVHELMKLPGLGLNSSWLLLTFVATTAALIVFFGLLYDHFKIGLFVSALFTLMLACTLNYTLYNYRDIWLVDPLNNLFYVLALLFLLQRRLWAFSLTVLLGSLNKETMMMLAPLYPLLVWMRNYNWRSREIVMAILSMAGVVFLYLIYHALVLLRLGPGSYRFLAEVHGSVLDTIRFSVLGGTNVEPLHIFQVFDFLWFYFAYILYRLYQARGASSDWLVIGCYMFASAVFGRLFATDTARVYVMMAPAVLGVTALAFNGFRGERQRLWILLLGAGYVALNFGWFSQDLNLAVNIASIVVFILALEADKLNYRKIFAESERHTSPVKAMQ